MADALMSGFAMFSLKDPSLLAFDERRNDDGKLMNLQSVYGIGKVPCDTTMRTILDDVILGDFSTSFKTIFSNIQRGGALNRHWTLKEAFLKYIKMGFNESLHMVEIIDNEIFYHGKKQILTSWSRTIDDQYILSVVADPQ